MSFLKCKHLEEVGETYFQHLKVALFIAYKLNIAAVFQFLHALFPFFSPPFRTDIKSLIEDLALHLPEVRANENKQ